MEPLPLMLRGYARDEVDAFLDRCSAVPGVDLPDRGPRPITGPAPTVDEVVDVQFRRQLRGYAIEPVDRLLDAIAERLRSQ